MKHKHAATDYTQSMLPQTRKALFFDILHLQWKNLLLMGGLGLLFYAPLLLSTVFQDVYISSLYSTLTDADDRQLMEASQTLMHLDVIRNFIHILFAAIFSVALAGMGRVIRQHAWGENVHTYTDFTRGIRENFCQTAVLAMLASLIYALCLMIFYNATQSDFLTGALSMLPIGISLLVVLPVLATANAMVPVYSNRLWATLKNAFYVYCRSLLKTLGGLFACLLIWVPSLIPNFYCHLFGSIGAVLLTPFALLAWTLLCYNRFDKHINPLVAPQLISKGIIHS